MLEKEVIEPRNQERYQGKNPYYRYDMEPFRVRRKDFWLLSTVTKLLNEFIPKLSHDADGLIFQGWDDPYVPRTHEGLLKWKYADLDSVDFLFEIDDDRQLLFLYERGKKKLMEGYIVAFEGIRCNNCQNVGATSGDFIQLTSSIFGEVSIDFADYAEATKISLVSLPIKNSHSDAVLHVSIQRLHENTDRSLRTYLSND
ncbi:mRNA-capping enzyme [Trifolium repens]|nr:mRNA-capping enzyme [Trifolium repens]KAK2423262.1 mRNA-capping enzyme [Trifolium repens]KAK2453262.1 mRNA-capping enzyme [Trifolium repens]